MQKFCVKGDSSANPFFSSSIIVNGLNDGAKKMGLYDENGAVVVYSTTANDYGNSNAKAIYCVYEFPFPIPVLQNLNGRPIIGSCIDNMFFASLAGYPASLIGYVPLGVDNKIFTPQKRTGNKDVFRFLSFAESNTRCGLDVLLDVFGETFAGNKNVELFIKDRNPTQAFQDYVKYKESYYNCKIIHSTENTQNVEALKQIYSEADAHVFLNRSSTWALTCIESLACGLPLITMNYSGPNNYLRHRFNGREVDYELEEITDELIAGLVQIGMKNFLFPCASYGKKPFWARPKKESIQKEMLVLFEQGREYLTFLGNNGILTASQFTWERAAVNMSYQLDAIEWNRYNPNLQKPFIRY